MPADPPPPRPSPLPGGAPLNAGFSASPDGPPPVSRAATGKQARPQAADMASPGAQAADMASPGSGDPSLAGLPPRPVATPGETRGGGRDGGEGGANGSPGSEKVGEVAVAPPPLPGGRLLQGR